MKDACVYIMIIYTDKHYLLKCSLEKDSSVSIHDRNSQCLASKMLKVSNELSPPLISNNFRQKK